MMLYIFLLLMVTLLNAFVCGEWDLELELILANGTTSCVLFMAVVSILSGLAGWVFLSEAPAEALASLCVPGTLVVLGV